MVWAPKKNAPKKVLARLYSYIFHVKNTKIFSRDKYPSPNALKIKYFCTVSYNHWGLLGITKLSNPPLQENSMSQKCLNVVLIRVDFDVIKGSKHTVTLKTKAATGGNNLENV